MRASIQRWWQRRVQRWIRRHHPRQRGRYRIHRRRIYILPTAAGWLYATLCLVVLLAAMNYSNSLAFGLAFWLGAIGFVCMHETHANVLNCSVELSPPDAVFAGELCWQPVTLRNFAQRPRMALQIAPERAPNHVAETVNCDTQTRSHFQWPSTTRGVQPVPRFSVSSRWPLGLFHAWTWAYLETDQLVYPKPAENPPNPPLKDRDSDGIDSKSADADEIDGLREYTAGDNPRSIHWRSLATHDQLATKTVTGQESDSVLLDLEQLPTDIDTETKLSILCRHILDLDAENTPYGLRLGHQQIGPDRGAAHRNQCLEALARYAN